jgi:hypothetical protein
MSFQLHHLQQLLACVVSGLFGGNASVCLRHAGHGSLQPGSLTGRRLNTFVEAEDGPQNGIRVTNGALGYLGDMIGRVKN